MKEITINFYDDDLGKNGYFMIKTTEPIEKIQKLLDEYKNEIDPDEFNDVGFMGLLTERKIQYEALPMPDDCDHQLYF